MFDPDMNIVETVEMLQRLAERSDSKLVVLPALLEDVQNAIVAYREAAAAVVSALAVHGDCPTDVLSDMKDRFAEFEELWASLMKIVEVHDAYR